MVLVMPLNRAVQSLFLVQSLLLSYYYKDDIRDLLVTPFVKGFRHAPDEDPSGVGWQGSSLTHCGTMPYSIALLCGGLIGNHPSLSSLVGQLKAQFALVAERQERREGCQEPGPYLSVPH